MEGVYWMGQSKRSWGAIWMGVFWGPFLHLQPVVAGVPRPACMRCMRANFILENGASWCSGQPSPSNFSLKLKLNAGRILDGAAPASIFAFASTVTTTIHMQFGPQTLNPEQLLQIVDFLAWELQNIDRYDFTLTRPRSYKMNVAPYCLNIHL